jgi:peptidoglycan/LPS O-acetylase OafA/YrhL
VLDGLRLVAALSVVAYHYMGRGTEAWEEDAAHHFQHFHPSASYGWLGVELFFLISGFVICMSSWGRSVGDFFISRVVRLYPAYWFAVIVTAIVLMNYPVIKAAEPMNHVLINLTMLQDPNGVSHLDGVYWTLWAELRFYLLWALVVWRGVTYRRAVYFCVLWSVASLFAHYTPDQMIKDLIEAENSSYFIAGVAMYLMYRFGPNLLLWCIVGLSFLTSQLNLSTDLSNMAPLTGAAGNYWVALSVLAGIYLLMIAVALGWLDWAKWRWLTAAGALTYPLYLLHEVIGWSAIRRFHAMVPKWPLLFSVIVGMLVLAGLVHLLIEKPFAPLLRRGLKRAVAEVRKEMGRRSAPTPAEPVTEPAGALPVDQPRHPPAESEAQLPTARSAEKITLG